MTASLISPARITLHATSQPAEKDLPATARKPVKAWLAILDEVQRAELDLQAANAAEVETHRERQAEEALAVAKGEPFEWLERRILAEARTRLAQVHAVEKIRHAEANRAVYEVAPTALAAIESVAVPAAEAKVQQAVDQLAVALDELSGVGDLLTFWRRLTDPNIGGGGPTDVQLTGGVPFVMDSLSRGTVVTESPARLIEQLRTIRAPRA